MVNYADVSLSHGAQRWPLCFAGGYGIITAFPRRGGIDWVVDAEISSNQSGVHEGVHNPAQLREVW